MLTVKRDPQIKFPEIVVGLMVSDDPHNSILNQNTSGIDQTEVYGVLCPLLALNGIVVDMPDLIKFKLDCTGVLPTVEFEFRDRNNLFAKFCQPGTSNILQLQIIPPTDNTYRKINMLFYVTDISINLNMIEGTAVYKTEGLLHSRAHAMGEMTTYELCDRISVDSQLGFATNIAGTEDKRYMYADYTTYGDMLKEEIKNSAADGEHVYDCWIDPWNYLVLCDMYERYNHIDDVDELSIWVSDHNTGGEAGDKSLPFRAEAVLSNHPAMERTELFVRRYEVITDNQYVKRGTEKATTVYNMNTHEYVGHYVADGDIKKDAFVDLEYGGEMYGDYDYIFSKQCRDMFMRKMNAEIMELNMTSPVFGLNRGDQCRFVWLDNDSQGEDWEQELRQWRITADASELKTDDMSWIIGWYRNMHTKDDNLRPNLQVSGQYTVIGFVADYENGAWQYRLRMVRPITRKPELMIDLNADE